MSVPSIVSVGRGFAHTRTGWKIVCVLHVHSGSSSASSSVSCHSILSHHTRPTQPGTKMSRKLKVFAQLPDSVTHWLLPSIQRSSSHVIAGTSTFHDELSQVEAVIAAYHPSTSFHVGSLISTALNHFHLPVLCLLPRNEDSTLVSRSLNEVAASHYRPLLSVHQYQDEHDAGLAVDQFLYLPQQPGRVFTVEGGDGAGKQTQSRMLVERLRAEGYPVQTIDFPNDNALVGKLIRQVLAGEKGDLHQVHPMLFAALYAINRYDVKPILDHWVRKGQNIVLDRYLEANFGHQACKLKTETEQQFAVASLKQFEEVWLSLPASHRVLYLDLPVEEAQKAMKSRAVLDEHERDTSYAELVRQAFLKCCQWYREQWRRIPCINDEEQARFTVQDLHTTIYNELKSEFVNKDDPYLQHL